MSRFFVTAFLFFLLALQAGVALPAKPSAQAQAAAQKKKLEAVQAQIKMLAEDQKKLELQRAEANQSVREMDAKVAQASKLARQSIGTAIATRAA